MSENAKANVKVMIALPSASELFYGETVEALMNMKVTPNIFTKVVGGELPDKARNFLTRVALEQGATHLLFVDDDNPPPQNALARLLEANKDIVCAPVLSRHEPYVPCIYKKTEIPNNTLPGYEHIAKVDTTGGTLVQIDACGMACTLIKREVLEKLFKKYEGQPFAFSKDPIAKVDKKDKREMSEDISFCERATMEGFTIWCDTTIRPRHFAGRKVVQFNDNMTV